MNGNIMRMIICAMLSSVMFVCAAAKAETVTAAQPIAAVQLVQQTTAQQDIDAALLAIKQQFTLIQDAAKEATYASYLQVLAILDQLYTLAAQWQKAVPASVIELENSVLAYIDKLFKQEYPTFVADAQKRTLLCLQELEHPLVADKEAQVVKKEKGVAAYLGHTNNDQQLSSAQLPLKRKQFLTSPCWVKRKIQQQNGVDKGSN